jgi:hypothetical protein
MRTAASGEVEIDLVMWSVAEAGARVGVGGVGARWEARGAQGSGCGVVGADDEDDEDDEERGDGRRPRLWEVEILPVPATALWLT